MTRSAPLLHSAFGCKDVPALFALPHTHRPPSSIKQPTQHLEPILGETLIEAHLLPDLPCLLLSQGSALKQTVQATVRETAIVSFLIEAVMSDLWPSEVGMAAVGPASSPHSGAGHMERGRPAAQMTGCT